MMHRFAAFLGLAGLVFNCAAQAAQPLAFETPIQTLNERISCSGNIGTADRSPVLLIAGAGQTVKSNYGWNWIPFLQKANIPYCAVDLPVLGSSELQVGSEYVTHAIRTTYARAGNKKIHIIGFSMGGALPRWSIRFWPDVRPMIDDLISLAGVNHGTLDAVAACLKPCAPAIWQLRTGSAFMAALNKDFETVPGISYTALYTRTDEVAVPNFNQSGTSSLRVGPGVNAAQVRNIASQDVCPLNFADHLLAGTSDPVFHALALDAIIHAGPADPKRIPRSICLKPFMPGVDPVMFPLNFISMAALTFTPGILLTPSVSAEPPLKPYVAAGN